MFLMFGSLMLSGPAVYPGGGAAQIWFTKPHLLLPWGNILSILRVNIFTPLLPSAPGPFQQCFGILLLELSLNYISCEKSQLSFFLHPFTCEKKTHGFILETVFTFFLSSLCVSNICFFTMLNSLKVFSQKGQIKTFLCLSFRCLSQHTLTIRGKITQVTGKQ